MIALAAFPLLLMQFAEPATAADEDSETAALMAIIHEETEIATKTRMNSDYVPGVVTVLQGKELAHLGALTVWEALAMVPGVQTLIDRLGRPSLAVRGIDFPFNSGNVKLLVDGVPLSRDMSGITSQILWMPIEQVERIEVIRGPGSVIHGDFAFMGLLNIVTRKDTTGIYARGQSDRLAGGGAMASWTRDDLHLYTNLSGFRGFGYPLLAGRSADLHRAAGTVGLQTKGLTLSAHIIDHAVNETTDAVTPAPVSLNLEERNWMVQAGYERELTPTLYGAVRAGFGHNDMGGSAASFRGDMVRLGSDFTYTGWERQSWFVALEYIRTDIERARQVSAGPAIAPVLPGPGGPGGAPAQPPRHIVNVVDQRREVLSMTLQDQLDVSEQWSFIPGIRFDSYSDVANRFTPRFALVWRASENHIIKGQYAEGFRAPTFFELYDGTGRDQSLGFEVNKTSELHYTFRHPETVFRSTVFYSEISDMLYRSTNPGIDNVAAAQTYGVEVELTRQIAAWAKFAVNGTWFHSEDNRNAAFVITDNPSSPAWMSNVAFFLSPLEHTVFGPHWNHVAATHMPAGAAYDLVDLTLTRSHLGLQGLEARIGAKNIFDETPVYITRGPNGAISNPSGFGRSYWLGIGWEL